MIVREDVGETAVLRMAHGKVSALDVDFCYRLEDQLASVASSQARAAILTGSGSAFSAGVDLFRVLSGGGEYLSLFLPAMELLFRTLLEFPKPLVGAINGHAIAGGCIMAATCDHRIMADGNGRIGIPELAVGVPFPTLPFEIMRARVTPGEFRSLVVTGRTVSAADARACGLIDEIAPADGLMPRARAVAEELATIPALTFALTKRTFAAPILERVRNAAALNAEVLAAWADPVVQQRVRAYLAKTVGRK